MKTNPREYTPMALPHLSPPLPDSYDPRSLGLLPTVAAVISCTGAIGQFGLFGRRCEQHGRPLGIALDEPLALALFGDNASGKSYALSVFLELFLLRAQPINVVKQPHCAVAFHYHPGASYEPELIDGVFANLMPREAAILNQVYLGVPQGLPDIVVLAPADKVPYLRARYPYLQVHPLRFTLAELGMDGLRSLLGLSSGQRPLYAQQVELVISQMVSKKRQPLTWHNLLDNLAAASFSTQGRTLLLARLHQVRPWIEDDEETGGVRSFQRPGRLILADLRSEWMERSTAMLLSGLVLSALVLHEDQRKRDSCPNVVCIDEAHKFVKAPELRRLISTMVKERRHLNLSVLLASQDPQSLPEEILPLLDVVGILRHRSEAWNRHLGKHIHPLKEITADLTSQLPSGAMILWAKGWVTDGDDPDQDDLPDSPIVALVRPRMSLHGGGNKGVVLRTTTAPLGDRSGQQGRLIIK